MKKNLRKKIRAILIPLVNMSDFPGDWNEHEVDQLSQLFEKEILEIIGEDEEMPEDMPKSNESWTIVVDAVTRNQLRQELREKVKHE